MSFLPRRALSAFLKNCWRHAQGAPDPKPVWPITRQELRDAIIALDGQCAGASHRQTAEVIYGAEQVKEESAQGNSWATIAAREGCQRGA